jgi:hypothetical protein
MSKYPDQPSLACEIIIVAVAVASCFLAGCRSQHDGGAANLARPVAMQCEPPSSETFFFPSGTFSTSEDDGSSKRYVLSSVLHTAKEPSLSCGPTPDEGYRLLRVDAFEHEVQAIRIDRLKDAYTISTRVLRSGATDPSFVLRTTVDKSLSREQWSTIASAIEQTNFWFMPPRQIKVRDALVFDADTWILEGRLGSSYHVIERISLEEGQAFTAACRVFFTAAGTEVPTDCQVP